jgi:DNA end-binding protein Ku
MFVPADSIEWIWYDTPHYLTPDDPVGEEAFSVIRDAMESTGMVGVSRLVLYRRERAVMLEPRDKGIVLWTLRYGDEVRDPNDYFGKIGEVKIDSKLLNPVTKLIEEHSRPWDRNMVSDPVQARLLDIIAKKNSG